MKQLDKMQSKQLVSPQGMLLVLMALLGTTVWLFSGAADHHHSTESDVTADVSDEENRCSQHVSDTDSEYARILDQLLADLTYSVAEEPEDSWMVSDYGLFARAKCWVEDWTQCASCVSLLANKVGGGCPRAKVGRIVSTDCAIEYAFDTKTIADEDDVLFGALEPIEFDDPEVDLSRL